MAYLLDPKHDGEVLKLPERSSAPAGDENWRTFVSALRAYRKGKYKVAKGLVNNPGVAKYFGTTSGFVSKDEFLQLCDRPTDPKAPPDPTLDLVRKIIRIELDEGSPPVKATKAASAGGSWQAAASARGRQVSPPLTLEALTEFDPRDNVFKDGKWQRPNLQTPRP
jgi:hypothetical protein